MEVRARERLVGALILVTAVVLLVPALLRGPQPSPGAEATPPETRSVEVTLAEGAAPPGDDELVPEPEAAPAAPLAAPPPGAEDAGTGRAPAPAQAEKAAPEPAPTPAPPAAAARRAETAAWAVQLGAFSTRDKAEGLVAELRSRGYAAFVLEYRGGGQLLHRVRVGPEQDRARAVAIAERLRKDGFQPVVAPHP